MQAKNHPRFIRISDYSYQLPESKIALFPMENRDKSKLLVFQNDQIDDHIFSDLPHLLTTEHALVFNNTKVVQARLLFTRESGSIIEIFCLEPVSPNTLVEQALQATKSCTWKCMVGNAKRWKEDYLSIPFYFNGKQALLKAKMLARVNDYFEIQFEWLPETLSFCDVLAHTGNLPLPPYLNRAATEKDKLTYQTVFAKYQGSVAAPTAGLHFTHDVLTALNKKGIKSTQLTLHVGAGTFKPVKSATMEEHGMHAEWIQVGKGSIEFLLQAKQNHKIITPVGTTSTRTIESIYWFGNKLLNQPETVFQELNISQWEPYENVKQHTTEAALQAVLNWMKQHNTTVLTGQTQLLIAPGYSFKLTGALITNFHQPQSTLLLLVAAFTGNNAWEKIYAHALGNHYRFLSYGDSSLLYPSGN